MKPIEIEVIWHTDETKVLADSGMDFDIDVCVHKTMTFYSIDAIIPYEWDKNHTDFCQIHSANQEWITPFSYDEVKKMIENE